MTIVHLSSDIQRPRSEPGADHNVTLLANDIWLRLSCRRHAFMGDEKRKAPVDTGVYIILGGW